ncbi:hypothetical protein F2Q65_06360 [Thiohalocapsa marina]|uniref:Uncharacterized protein n=1 Tax=Thiohalocapsa marina TaxID=424902 RepID=A0A5M8FMB5_9GAMM|nr:hypothetical protein [Thiohalocapsa marina]KAA6185988.1 hypothetical protein F2Q65_06360 [Thiohalocapsa marina]
MSRADPRAPLPPSATTETRHYSLRRVNPFLGTVAVVRTPGGRALSLDGCTWQLQVAARPPRGLWSGGGHAEELRFFRFGFWSVADGVTRVPLNPVLDVGLMLQECDQLVAELAAVAQRLPFPLAPELELWLLDRDDAPLALLATAMEQPDPLPEVIGADWSAGARGDRPFRSEHLAARGIAEAIGAAPAQHARYLERQIGDAAGNGRRMQWFRRDAAGGLGLGQVLGQGAPAGLADRRLPAGAFPALTLRTQWADADATALVRDYVRWLSPYLLMLPTLDERQRAELEQDAARHARLVAGLWRLYPRIIDQALLRRARVEAELRRAHEGATEG